MGHIASQKDALIQRVRKITGQLQAVERALTADADCAKTMHLVAAARGAINGLLDQIIEEHIREHVAHPDLDAETRRSGADQLVAAIRRYAK